MWTGKFDVTLLGAGLLPLLLGEKVVIARLVFTSVLPLDFHGRLRVVRTVFIPGAVHGIEASLLGHQ